METTGIPGKDLVVQGLVRDGAEVRLVQVYAAYTRGFAGIQLLGNLAEVCRSGKERARAALEAMDIKLGARKLVLGFTPAGIRIDGAHMDLPIAMALATRQPGGSRQGGSRQGGSRDRGTPEATARSSPVVFAAEVGLGGELRAVPGMVALALGAARHGCRRLVVARENLDDLRGIDLGGLEVLGFEFLSGVFDWLDGDDSGARACQAEQIQDGADASGQGGPRRDPGWPLFEDMHMPAGLALAAMAVAAGRHSILLRGAPGSGKTMFAQRVPGIMPPPEGRQRLHALHLHNLAGNPVAAIRGGVVPFRSPHHGASMAAILGSHRCPGEISLAHGGILFLDELPEFRRDLLESLREPLETGEVHLARVQGHVVWPADTVLVAASNNCPCGWYGSRFRECDCATGQVAAYQSRMSGPLLDRIDIHFNMPEREVFPRDAQESIPGRAAQDAATKWTTAELRERVQEALAFARSRNRSLGIEESASGAVMYNSRVPDRILRNAPEFLGRKGADPVAELTAELLSGATGREGERAIQACRSISARGLIRSLRVARTLADLDTVEAVGYEHFRQAVLWQAGAAALERGDLGFTGPRERRSTWNSAKKANGSRPGIQSH